ncbi:MAG: ComEC/Rec2 family competence protein [Sphingopyxis sp.]
MAHYALQTAISAYAKKAAYSVEKWLWFERESLILWVPVAFGCGISAWFILPGPSAWAGFAISMMAIALFARAAVVTQSLFSRSVMIAALAAFCGLLTIWGKSWWVAAPVLERPAVVAFTARVVGVEQRAAHRQFRLLLEPETGAGLPPRVRVTYRDDARGIDAITKHDRVRLRARLVPPPRAALPGGYDYSRRAWFEGIGAVGTGLGPIVRGEGRANGASLRTRLSAHIQTRVSGGSGSIAAALATGDRGGMSSEDDEAMRRSGLAHLLSVSGLHVTAVVAGTMWLILRLLALSPWVALRWPLSMIAAAGGALTGFGYTILTGGEVPTVRSLLATLLVLVALAMGREAISMRLIAAGAMVVMLLWPEALVGPSFQLSFAAVASIVALHAQPWVMRKLARRGEPLWRRFMRNMAGLLATGLVVEITLIPIALFHFHKTGLYGALANMVAIPLTTFVIMPAEALGIAMDIAGAGAPAWWVVQKSLDALLWLAHLVATAPGSVSSLPTMPISHFAMIVFGGLWLFLWRGRARWIGSAGVAIGLLAAMQIPSPDILITNDGRHVAVRLGDGGYAMLRERAGDFTRDQLAEAAGIDGALSAVADMPDARCSADFCVWQMTGQGQAGQGQAGSDRMGQGQAGSDRMGQGRTGQGRPGSGQTGSGRIWTIMATRSAYQSDWRALVAACAKVDIVIADRRMPRGCHPRWLMADRGLLAQTGGLAIMLNPPSISGSAAQSRHMPWALPQTIMPPPLSAARVPRRYQRPESPIDHQVTAAPARL